MPDLDAAAAAAAERLTALDQYLNGDGPAPDGLPAGCCGECHSCEAALAVAAAWPVFLADVLAYLRDVGAGWTVLDVAAWLERDFTPPT